MVVVGQNRDAGRGPLCFGPPPSAGCSVSGLSGHVLAGSGGAAAVPRREVARGRTGGGGVRIAAGPAECSSAWPSCRAYNARDGHPHRPARYGGFRRSRSSAEQVRRGRSRSSDLGPVRPSEPTWPQSRAQLRTCGGAGHRPGSGGASADYRHTRVTCLGHCGSAGSSHFLVSLNFALRSAQAKAGLVSGRTPVRLDHHPVRPWPLLFAPARSGRTRVVVACCRPDHCDPHRFSGTTLCSGPG